MRIFSNFDTRGRENAVAEYTKQYGEEFVLCFGRSKLYWFVRIFFPFMFISVLVAAALLMAWYFLEHQYFLYIVIAVLALSSFFYGPLISRYIDYKMDFIIVTPDTLTLYEQLGFWSKKIITVNEKSIKTISVEKSGFWYSVFNNGDLIFLAEGDVTSHGDITLKRVPKPEKRRDQIAVLMNKE